MAYIFDPKDWNSTSFTLDEYHMLGDWRQYRLQNKPIPASCFPKALTVVDAIQAMPEMFHTSRSYIVFSERARAVVEERASGQVEFIPVTMHAVPQIADRLNLASAYYFINVLGRAQRLQWFEMPTKKLQTKEDGTEIWSAAGNYHQWKFRERTADEPLIWHETRLPVDTRVYSKQAEVFIEDALWQELNSRFAGQLNEMRVGQ
jgi:hypothetical protein